MIALLLALQATVVSGVVVDANSGAPVASATVSTMRARTVTSSDGRFALAVETGDSVRVRRVGYAPALLVVAGRTSLDVRLAPVASPLVAIVTSARADAGRLEATASVADARAGAVATLPALLATLPFVMSRGARGDATLSLRGARAEQVAVTLDGLSLNDAATGIADLSDLPLVAIGSVRVAPGANGVGAGSGAAGGTVALRSGEGSTITFGAGAFGRRSLEAAVTLAAGPGAVRVGGAWSAAMNDFPFVNTDGATGSDSIERRVNNDDARTAIFATAMFPRAQALVLASRTERGLVGPMNVRVYDDDRGTTDRLLARVAVQFGAWMASSGLRHMDLRYHDGHGGVNDFVVRTLSADVELAGRVADVGVRAGAGADEVSATGLAPPRRARGFVAGERGWEWHGARLLVGLRMDAIEFAGAEPSASLAIEATGRIAPFFRVGQAFRAPTMYDLYLSAPQRLAPRALRPERVDLDAEAGVRAALGPVTLSASAFRRDTRDAIVWFPGNFTWSPDNVGSERVTGAEGQVAVRTGTTELSAWGGVYDAVLTAGALLLPTPYVPQVAGGARAAVGAGPLGITLTLRGTGRRAWTAAPSSPDIELPAVLLGDIALNRRFVLGGRHALVAVGVTDVADTRWESVRRFPAPGRSWSVALTLDP